MIYASFHCWGKVEVWYIWLTKLRMNFLPFGSMHLNISLGILSRPVALPMESLLI